MGEWSIKTTHNHPILLFPCKLILGFTTWPHFQTRPCGSDFHSTVHRLSLRLAGHGCLHFLPHVLASGRASGTSLDLGGFLMLLQHHLFWALKAYWNHDEAAYTDKIDYICSTQPTITDWFQGNGTTWHHKPWNFPIKLWILLYCFPQTSSREQEREITNRHAL